MRKERRNKNYLRNHEGKQERYFYENLHHIPEFKGKRGPYGKVIDGKLIGGNRYRYCYNCGINHNRYGFQEEFFGKSKKKKIHIEFKNTFWNTFEYLGVTVYHIYNKAVRQSKKGQFNHYINGKNETPYKELICNHKKPMMQCLFCTSFNYNQQSFDHQEYGSTDQIMMINDQQKCNAEMIVIIKGEPIKH